MEKGSPKNSKNNVFLGVIALLVVLLTAIIVKTIWSPSKQQLGKQSESKQNVAAEGVSEPAQGNTIKKQHFAQKEREVTYSTPKVHDQLLLSPIFEGSNIDGAVQADQYKQLILNIGIRDFFDYFLTAVDEVGIDKAIDEIKRHINQSLPEPAKTQAIDLLAKYVSFKQTEYQIQQTPIAQGSLNNQNAIIIMRESFDALKSSRESLFSNEQNEALFGLENIYAEHTLSILELMADESLSSEERNQGLQKIEANLPPELSNSFAETRAQSKQAEFVQNIVNSDLDNAQVHSRLLEQGLSNDQADQAIIRRQQQIDFNETYQQYSSELVKLDQNQVNYETSRTVLLKRFFSSPEAITQAKLRDLSQ